MAVKTMKGIVNGIILGLLLWAIILILVAKLL